MTTILERATDFRVKVAGVEISVLAVECVHRYAPPGGHPPTRETVLRMSNEVGLTTECRRDIVWYLATSTNLTMSDVAPICNGRKPDHVISQFRRGRIQRTRLMSDDHWTPTWGWW